MKPVRHFNTGYASEFSANAIRRRKYRSVLARFFWYSESNVPAIAWRIFEFLASACIALLMLPVLLVAFALAKYNHGGILRTRRVGFNGKEFDELSLSFSSRERVADQGFLARLPALLNVLRGEMSLVGPRTLSRTEVILDNRSLWKRFGVRPGLVGLWWVRRRANIAYDGETLLDAEYADTKGVWTDIGLLARSIVAVLYGVPKSEPEPGRIAILGVSIDNLGMDEAIEHILSASKGSRLFRVGFVNVDCINIAQRQSEYLTVLRGFDLVLADGIGLKLAGNLLKTPIRQNVNGTDLLPRLCEGLEKCASRVYLLGGVPGVAESVAVWMAGRFPGLLIAGCQHGYYSDSQLPEILSNIHASGADVLLVALGAPKQEIWIHKNAAEAGVKVAIGVGGLFDFYSGRMDRAPLWVREVGMEWLFRLYKEPRRMWKRYLVGNVTFAMRLMRDRLRALRAGGTP
jgi:N-acetylglucosaminyldiphosphoundecaprenol N-acetyl-beta-D-mannosaminyltransferase